MKRPPLDIVLTGGLTVLLGAVLAMNLASGSALRTGLVLFVIVLVPGYLLIAILYPRHGQCEGDGFQPNLVQRFALSFGTSIALLALFGLVPAVVGLPYTYSTINTVILFALVLEIVVAAYRRMAVPEASRFKLPIPGWFTGTFSWIRDARRYQQLTRTLVVVSILLATMSFGYVLAVPQDNEQYSTMTLLSENAEGELVASGYPTNLTAGEPAEYTLAVTNNRDEEVTYTVVARLEQVRTENGSTQIVNAQRLREFQATVAVGETWEREHEVEPTMTGDDLRLRYYLYRGSAPEQVTAASATNHLHLWMDVEQS